MVALTVYKQMNKPKVKFGERLMMRVNSRTLPVVLLPVNVVKVGRKYFSVRRLDGYSIEYRFYLSDWREENGGYSSDLKLYTSEQAFRDEQEQQALANFLRGFFSSISSERVPVEKLRAIKVLCLEQ